MSGKGVEGIKKETESKTDSMSPAPSVKINIFSAVKNETKPVKVRSSVAPIINNSSLKKETEHDNKEGVLMTVTVTKKERDVTTTEVSEVTVPVTSPPNKDKKRRRVYIRHLYNTKTKKYRLEVSTSAWISKPKSNKADAATNTSLLDNEGLLDIALDLLPNNSGSSMPTTICNRDLYPNAEFSSEPAPRPDQPLLPNEEDFLMSLLDDDELSGLLPLAPAAIPVPVDPGIGPEVEHTALDHACLFDDDFMTSLQSYISEFE